jgi:hypothetical protein
MEFYDLTADNTAFYWSKEMLKPAFVLDAYNLVSDDQTKTDYLNLIIRMSLNLENVCEQFNDVFVKHPELHDKYNECCNSITNVNNMHGTRIIKKTNNLLNENLLVLNSEQMLQNEVNAESDVEPDVESDVESNAEFKAESEADLEAESEADSETESENNYTNTTNKKKGTTKGKGGKRYNGSKLNDKQILAELQTLVNREMRNPDYEAIEFPDVLNIGGFKTTNDYDDDVIDFEPDTPTVTTTVTLLDVTKEHIRTKESNMHNSKGVVALCATKIISFAMVLKLCGIELRRETIISLIENSLGLLFVTHQQFHDYIVKNQPDDASCVPDAIKNSICQGKYKQLNNGTKLVLGSYATNTDIICSLIESVDKSTIEVLESCYMSSGAMSIAYLLIIRSYISDLVDKQARMTLIEFNRLITVYNRMLDLLCEPYMAICREIFLDLVYLSLVSNEDNTPLIKTRLLKLLTSLGKRKKWIWLVYTPITTDQQSGQQTSQQELSDFDSDDSDKKITSDKNTYTSEYLRTIGTDWRHHAKHNRVVINKLINWISHYGMTLSPSIIMRTSMFMNASNVIKFLPRLKTKLAQHQLILNNHSLQTLLNNKYIKENVSITEEDVINLLVANSSKLVGYMSHSYQKVSYKNIEYMVRKKLLNLTKLNECFVKKIENDEVNLKYFEDILYCIPTTDTLGYKKTSTNTSKHVLSKKAFEKLITSKRVLDTSLFIKSATNWLTVKYLKRLPWHQLINAMISLCEIGEPITIAEG